MINISGSVLSGAGSDFYLKILYNYIDFRREK